MKVLVTGGAGYIGSHTLVELHKEGYDTFVVDNLVNSSLESLNRVEKITGKKPGFAELDVCDSEALDKIFKENEFDAVIHFAGLKAVGESVQKPLYYYRNNIDSTLSLCEAMQRNDVKQFIFSSSATVYGVPQELPLKESTPAGTIPNPYGQTKAMIEQILRDAAVASSDWKITLLRYFNPIGAHESGLIGEDPNDIPNNLLPYISQVAIGRLEKLSIYGNDYDTPDGTGVRDYIHVVDLAKGHVAALKNITHSNSIQTYNLGTGKGVSVMELLRAFEDACGKKLPYQVVDRRPGDVPSCFADATKAMRELNWVAEKSIQEACIDTWRWQSQNPNGYKS